MSSVSRIVDMVGDLGPVRPAYLALAERLRLLIVDGAILPGTRLPSEREFTTALGLSRTTVTRAYDVLRDKGFAVSRQGSGTRARLPDERRRSGTGVLLTNEPIAGFVDLTCAATRAPAGMAEAYAWAVERLPAYLAGAGYFGAGVPELRSAIAERYAARGLPTDPDQILITSGAVAGAAILADVLVRPGTRVLVESPAYPNSIELLRRRGARLAPTPVDPRGWDLATTERDLQASGAEVALLIPDFHNPTGAHLDADQRARLARALRGQGTTAIVDETLAETWLGEAPATKPFAAYEPGAFLVGSASKTFWGGLRTGWIRAPRAAMPRLLEARAAVDLCAPVLEQLVTLRLLHEHDGMPSAGQDRLRESRDATVAALRERLPHWRFTVPSGGLSLWIDVGAGAGPGVVDAAYEHGVLLASGSRFAVRGRLDRWVRLPYVLAADEMREVVARLAEAVAATCAGERADRGQLAAPHGPLVA